MSNILIRGIPQARSRTNPKNRQITKCVDQPGINSTHHKGD